MTASAPCPGRNALRQFVLGLTDEQEAEKTEQHLANCAACVRSLESLRSEEDSILNALRGAGHAAPAVREAGPGSDAAALQGLMRRLGQQEPLAMTTDYAIERLGTTIGPYKLLEQIGEGGFGVVFMAEQQHPVRRKVALKVIKPGMDTRQVVARFEAERQALALMEHPNIARVLDGGETANGRPFFVMELVRGQPITKYCDEARSTTRERLSLFVDVCHAVQHAHQKGIIHRDLKPSNVLVTLHSDSPVVKVIDFGVAKATGEQLTDKTLFTGFAQFVGTPLYMSPEQAALSGLDIDTRSDVYSLGVLLYELLTGTTPLRPERIKKAAIDEVRRLICDEEAQRPSTRISTMGDTATEISSRRKTEPLKLRQLLRSELDWIVLKALEKDRVRRYDTVNGLASDVRRYLADEPVSACPPSTAYRLSKVVRRHRTAILAFGVVVAAILLGLVGTTWQAVRATLAESDLTTERDIARKQTEEAVANLKRAVTAEGQLKDQLWQSYYDQAQARRWSGRPGRRFESLEAIRKAAEIRPAKELRNEAIASMALADLKISREWEGFQGGMQEVASIFFNPDVQLYSRSDHHGLTSVRRVSNDEEIVRLQGPELSSLTQLFSPDGRFLAANYHPRHNANASIKFILWRIPEGEKVFELDQKMMHRALDFSPDSKLIAVGERDRTVRFYSTKDGAETMPMEVGKIPGILRFDPSGKRIAVSSFPDSQVEIRDVVSGKVTSTVQLAKGGIREGLADFAWHPRGDVLAVSGGSRFTLWNAADGTLQKSVEGHPFTTIDHLAFSREGDLLATIAWSSEMALWETHRCEEVLRVPLVTQHAWGQRFQFSPGDKELSYDLRLPNVRVWELAKGSECLQFFGNGGRHVAFHPQGRIVAVTDDEGLRLWDIATSRMLAYLKMQYCRGLQFHPSGDAFIVSRVPALERWALKFINSGEQIQLQVGPPETLKAGNFGDVVFSADGSEIVLASDQMRCMIFNWAEPGKGRELAPHSGMMNVAISMDEQWVATGAFHGTGVKIWNKEKGNLHRDLDATLGRALVAFSPDGKWLATSIEKGIRFWNTSDWSPGPAIETTLLGPLAFSPDGRLVAHMSDKALKLYVMPSCKEIATLTPPSERAVGGLAFSADSSRLAVSATGVLQIWDLRAIRERLAEMKLDWDLPAYPPAQIVDRRPIEVVVLSKSNAN